MRAQILDLYAQGIRLYVDDIAADESWLHFILTACCGNNPEITNKHYENIKNAIENKFKIQATYS